MQRMKAVAPPTMTENDLAHELVEMGVDKEDIILGLHPPYKRPYIGYGVA